MKKFSIFLLVIVILMSLCACNPTIEDDEGISRTLLYNSFVVLDEYSFDHYTMVVYNKTTSVVYYLQCDGHGGFLAPYLIYQDGYIYGAIYQDSKIIPVPYASTPLE
jgi:hypothetical protein